MTNPEESTPEFRPMAKDMKVEKLPYPTRQADMKQQPDSGIGRAVAIAFAKEGADVAVLYNENDEDAEKPGR